MHLRSARVGEADLDAAGDEGAHQALGAVHDLGPGGGRIVHSHSPVAILYSSRTGAQTPRAVMPRESEAPRIRCWRECAENSASISVPRLLDRPHARTMT